MVRHGIPPSPDRIEYQRFVLVSSVAVLLLAGGAFYFLALREGPREFPGPGPATPPYSPAAYAEEVTRADAYRALREYIDREARGPQVRGVYCRDSSHRMRGAYIEFKGDVDLERPNGRMDRHRYSATLRGAAGEGWEIISFTLQDAPEPRAETGQNPPAPRQDLPGLR